MRMASRPRGGGSAVRTTGHRVSRFDGARTPCVRLPDASATEVRSRSTRDVWARWSNDPDTPGSPLRSQRPGHQHASSNRPHAAAQQLDWRSRFERLGPSLWLLLATTDTATNAPGRLLFP